ncbi:MAG TPA: response regulator transcription factor [Anaerolineae bacterium]|nr:response regulator transcription factor [Anaerolineae bacterium]
MDATVLVVDDSAEFTELLQTYLEQQGYKVATASGGQEAINHLQSNRRADVILLDVMMPDIDGWQTCQRLREITNVPILMLTALGRETDLVQGLELGADDYLIKPFHLTELKARIEAHLRRARMAGWESPYPAYSDDELYIDLPNREVRLRGKHISLSPTEFRLLACLVRNAGIVVPHRSLLSEVWGPDYLQDIRSLKLYIRYLRQKIEPDPTQPRYVLTEWGVGYRFRDIQNSTRAPAREPRDLLAERPALYRP